jgi:hypothetical protein
VSGPPDLQPGESLSEWEHQRVRDRVPRNCGMLQAKATHLFFSEAMTEGTAGNRRRHHPLRSDPQKSKRRAVCGSKETPEPPSPRGQCRRCLCKHRGNHTAPTCTADSPRGSVDGTDEGNGFKPIVLAVPPMTADALGNGCVGPHNMAEPVQGASQRLRRVSELSSNEGRSSAYDDGGFRSQAVEVCRLRRSAHHCRE